MIEIHNDDCLTMLKGIKSKSVDLVITDPPYKVDTKGAGVYGSVASFKNIECMADGIKDEVLDELCRVMKKINIYLFCSKNQLVPLINTHRNFIGIEINAKFYETAKTRLISQKKLYLS